ncbi:hypothetical protein AcV7_005665 [Taiwanofungus camphoratus]|nr:hypothetical protein AcV7_005665 [Antrodia cinnamomea]
MGQLSLHEVRTGTADFIAVDIDSQKHLFKSKPVNDSSSGNNDVDKNDSARRMLRRSTCQETRRQQEDGY